MDKWDEHNQGQFLRQLVGRYTDGGATEEELELFFQLLEQDRLDDYLTAAMNQAAGLTGEEQVHAPVRRLSRWRRAAAAAAILILLAGAGLYLIHKSKQTPVLTATNYKYDKAPGGNHAILTLSNGQQIILDSAANGLLAQQEGSSINKLTNGELAYSPLAPLHPVGDDRAQRRSRAELGKGGRGEMGAGGQSNTLSTPRGGFYELKLPDGTKVWLNAASSITYPTAFTGRDRQVTITGEAYFEVVHNDKQPFKVIASGQTIRDIGTSFNINAYTDEPATRTTLVEGAATVNGILLKPGQQAELGKGNQIQLSAANIPQTIAWKNGFFGFDHADIHTVMRQLARWYDVDVKFQGTPDSAPFQGKIGRDLSLAQVLKILEQVHVHFRIEEDKRIVILP